MLNLFQTKIYKKTLCNSRYKDLIKNTRTKVLIILLIITCLLLALIACTPENGSQTLTTSAEQDTTTTPAVSTTTTSFSQPVTATTTIQTLTLDPTLDPTVFYVAYIVIDPKEATVTLGENLVFTVTGHDFEGNSFDITRDCDFIIDWEAGGRWEFNKYFPSNVGTWEVHADYWNPISGTEFWRDSATLVVE